MSDASDERVPCLACDNGRWFTECCNGAYGCSCRGDIIDMGPCNVCHGTGYHAPDADKMANVRTIEGYGHIGSGPRGGGFFDNVPRMGRV